MNIYEKKNDHHPDNLHYDVFILMQYQSNFWGESGPDPDFEQITFNSQAWRDGSYLIRGQMVKDLMDTGLLHNKSRSDVLSLLGHPDDTSEDSISYIIDIGWKAFGGKWLYSLFINFENGLCNNVWYSD